MRSLGLFSVCALLVFGCTPKKEVNGIEFGEIDPTHYVAVGSTMSSGYSDDALHYDGQYNNFGNIIYRQMAKGGAVVFETPYVANGSVGVNWQNESKLYLNYKTDCNGVNSLSPIRLAQSGDASILTEHIYNGPYGNMCIPGLHFNELYTWDYGNPAMGAGNYNPFFARMASDQANTDVRTDVFLSQPTLMTIMLGDEEIMDYAVSGGTSGLIPPAWGDWGVGLSGSLDELMLIASPTSWNTKGAIATVPNVLSAPYFTTIPYNGLNLTTDDAVTMNQVFNPLGISFVEGENPFLVEDSTTPFNVRKLEEGELILLSIPLDSMKCYGLGSIVPIPDQYVLSLDEISTIEDAIDEYNNVITTKAVEYDFAIADVKRLFEDIEGEIVYNGITMNAEFVSGGFYSLDGRNLNPMGHAMLANVFIAALNAKYNAKIPWADVTQFRGVAFP